MLDKLKYFSLGFLSALAVGVLAQTQILNLTVIEDLEVQGTPTVTNAGPALSIFETGEPADEGNWFLNVSTGNYRLLTRTDAGGVGTTVMEAVRGMGTAVDQVDFTPITTFANSGFADNSAVQIIANQAALQFEESDAPVDEGKWDMGVSAGDFFLDLNSDAGVFQIAAIQITRSGVNTISAYDIAGVDAFPETGTFEADFTNACTVTATATVDWYKIGGIATIIFEDAISCTSDSVDFNTGSSELPAAITPVRNIRVPISNITDNGTGQNGCIEFRSSGQIRILLNSGGVCSVGAFTNSGTKGILATVGATYMLDNP